MRISLASLNKTFSGGIVAVRDLSLDISDGELLVILGPSGCGKTTILRLIAGLERPTAGDVLFDGLRVTNMRPAKRHIGFVFQQPPLYPHLSVRENLAFVLRRRRLSAADLQERIATVSELFHIDAKLLERKPAEISIGEQQRSALARELLREPRCLLLDEPLASLDTPLRGELRREIRAAHDRLKLTSIFVTHDQQEAFALGDRIALLNHGELQQLGTPVQQYHAPANVFTAQFIGAPGMNLIEGQIDRHVPTGHAFFVGGAAMRIPLPHSLAHLEGRVTLGIRPEHIAIIDRMAGPDGDSICIEVVIQRVEPLGDHDIVYTSTHDNRLIIAKAHGQLPVTRGRAQLRIPFAAMHFFDDAGLGLGTGHLETAGTGPGCQKSA